MASTQEYDIPTNAEFLQVANLEDYLPLIIRVHQAIDTTLAAAISKGLPDPHGVEICRLSFNLKVDLAVALRIIRPDSRPVFVAVNRIRNAFAHQASATFGEKEATDLRNTLSPFQRYLLGNSFDNLADPLEILRQIVAILFIEGKTAMERLQEQKIETEAMHEMVEEVLAGSPVKQPDDPFMSQGYQELKERVALKKAALTAG
jgi:hypothetical protein